MGEVAESKVFELVKELCASVSVSQEEETQEHKRNFEIFNEEAHAEASVEMDCSVSYDKELASSLEMDCSISYDKVLAELFEMGYDIELASRAILECGCLDVAAIIDHMNSESPTSTAVAVDSSVMPTAVNSALPSSSMREKLEDEQQDVYNVPPALEYPSVSTIASTSRCPSSMEDQDELNEQQELRRSKYPLRSCQPIGSLKGKLAVIATTEDDADRWEYDDDPGTDKEASLLRMGFCQKDVTDALETCGENGDINELANYIMNNIVDLPDSNWEEDYDPVDEEDLVDGSTETVNDKVKGWRGEELTDQGLLIANKLRSMGCSFSTKMIVEAIQACGNDAADDTIVEYVLFTDERKVLGDTSGEALPLTKLEQLKGLGCTSTAACLRAIDNNRDADIYELLDYIHAEEVYDKLAEEDAEYGFPDSNTPLKRKRKSISSKMSHPSKSNSSRFLYKKEKKAESYYDEENEDEDEGDSRGIRRNMKGFGLPGEPVIPRQLSEDISRPPYFYFENVALTPKDEWKNIQRHLYNIEPEFVDSLNFSPCRRPRGYVHNLPVEGRVDVLPKPPMSIQELIPGAAGYWPAWDPRVKLNTINTRTASEFVRRQIEESMVALRTNQQSIKDIKTILFWARKWNLVWIEKGVLAPLRPEEVETCLGFDSNHTRVLYSPNDRVRVLGNSFQVNTVAYHLSVLRPMYCSGIRVLSLFSGIGGAEVALHKLGIFLKVVVSVEIDDKARMVVDSWWRTTNQKGRLIHTFRDVKDLDSKAIQSLVNEFGGFDLVIGGSPCNNLSGNNRCTRTGLAGPASVTFFEFPRILADVRDFMTQRRR